MQLKLLTFFFASALCAQTPVTITPAPFTFTVPSLLPTVPTSTLSPLYVLCALPSSVWTVCGLNPAFTITPASTVSGFTGPITSPAIINPPASAIVTQGPTGPQGIQGPIGLTGPVGPVGPQGIPGIPGASNGAGGTTTIPITISIPINVSPVTTIAPNADGTYTLGTATTFMQIEGTPYLYTSPPTALLRSMYTLKGNILTLVTPIAPAPNMDVQWMSQTAAKVIPQ